VDRRSSSLHPTQTRRSRPSSTLKKVNNQDDHSNYEQ